MRTRTLALCAALTAWCAAPGTAAQISIWDQEGPLANDTFVEIDPRWESGLRAGDDLWRQALDSMQQGSDGEAMKARALDAWQSVLASSSDPLERDPTDSSFSWVRGLDPASTLDTWLPGPVAPWARLYLTPKSAVAYRLQQDRQETGESAALAAWRSRFEPLAQRALAASPYDLPRLRAMEERYPWTDAAAIAALRASDAWREAGAWQSALACRARAMEHLGNRARSEPWRAHLDARDWTPHPNPQNTPSPSALGSSALGSNAKGSSDQGSGTPSPGTEEQETWRYLRAWRLESRRGRVAPGERFALGRGLRPGLVAREDGSVVVQTPQALVHIELDAEGLPQPGSKRVEALSDLLGLGRIAPITPASLGGWPHLPVLDRNRLYLVVDRARPGSNRFEIPVPPRSNHLVSLRLRAQGSSQVLWQRSSKGWKIGDGTWQTEVQPRGAYEWQPGPVLCDDKLWVLARSLAPVGEVGEEEMGPTEEFLYLMAFDARTGAWLHQTKLHKASDLAARDESSMARHMATPCAPLTLATDAGQILVQTNQGLCGVFDASTGEPEWMFAYRRRAPRATGWPGSQRPIHWAGEWELTPGDSDRAYRLQTARGAWPFENLRITAKGTRQAINARDAQGLTDYSWRGARSLVASESPQEERHLSFLLGREERFTGFPAVTATDVWAATNRGLYRMDRAKELYLEQRFVLPDKGAGIGGDIQVIGSRAWVLGSDTLWLLMSR